ncbi:DUF4214 domain-containing protein [Cellulomonas marina]|uniref:Uncharacterized conserved protein, contains LGFP repeats n=1 Tax=Cellulomonas marina TaxID=988821 RepID=A0A1I0UYW5_9CELL|nr:DUF4214 domain-containing protein [Cellulomonas marina]GIG29934.1 hypothetical protein Cma02nite_25340 [Cellulomonas marina]SFA68987.1 Uncharacterized conserved protein, contains LGFP repeats [Cellulomonas marina]
MLLRLVLSLGLAAGVAGGVLPAPAVAPSPGAPGGQVVAGAGVVRHAAAAASGDGTGSGTGSGTDSGTGLGADADVQVAEVPLVLDVPGDAAGAAAGAVAVDPLAPLPADAPVAALDTEEDGPLAPLVVDEGAAGRVVSEPVAVADFQTLGVTWADGPAPDVQVRTRTDDGWSAWTALEVGDDAPDAGTPDAEAAAQRAGTQTLWVGESDAVQVSVAAPADGTTTARDVELVLVGSEATGPAAVVRPAVAATPAAAGMPPVVTRAAWGAASPSCEMASAKALVGAVVHHTAGSNAYADRAQAMQQIRNDQAYHMQGRGWCDLGYNVIVDKFGTIYEGRAGSLDKAVIGVHAGGFNTGTLGVSMLGTFTTVAPSPAMTDAVARIVGWRLGAYGVDPRGTMQYWTGAGENSRFTNRTVTLPRVLGHRDVAYTACPGDRGYATLAAIRSAAAGYAPGTTTSDAASLVKALYTDLLDRPAEAGGVTSWSSLLVQGTSSADLVGVLTSSTEYRTLRVREAYEQVLGRSPDAGGAAGWVAAIAAGRLTVDDVQRLFYESPEFYQAAGATDAAFVTRVYEVMLGRAPGAAERDFWVARIAAGNRGQVAAGVWASLEAAQQRASGYYRTFLGRDPEWSGRVYWGQQLLERGEGVVRTGIAGSAEYWARALTRYPAVSA